MRQSLLDKKSSPKYGENGVVFFVSFCFLIFVSVSFYVSINNYLVDQRDRTLIASIFNMLNSINIQNTANSRVQQSITNTEQYLNTLISQCNQTRVNLAEDQTNLDNGFYPTFLYYNTINTTIMNQNASCVNQLNNLTIVLEQLLDAVNETGIVIESGTCQVNSPIFNDTIVVPFDYKLMNLSGLEYYYYVFTNMSGAVEASTGAFLENCSPVLFRGSAYVKPSTYVSGITTYPLDYLSYLLIGNEKIQFVPKTIPIINATLYIDQLKIWVNIF